MDLDFLFATIGICTEAAIVILGFRKQIRQSAPVFYSYVAWSFLSDLFYLLLRIAIHGSYSSVYLYGMAIDWLFQFAVLVELIWLVLRPIRSSLSRKFILAPVLLILLLGLSLWPVAGLTLPHNLGPHAQLWVHTQQDIALLRVTIFVLLASCSQLLSLNWHDRELQIATGLGFYSLCNLLVSILHTYQSVGAQYKRLDQALTACYLCTLFYWITSLLRRETERQQFTPQMRHMLLAAAGAARNTRLYITPSRRK
jgi:hypothetical protein